MCYRPFDRSMGVLIINEFLNGRKNIASGKNEKRLGRGGEQTMITERFRIAFTANGKREICVYVFLKKNEYINENSACKRKNSFFFFY